MLQSFILFSVVLEINPEKAFEKQAVEFLIEMNRKGILPFEFMDIGRWWHKTEEIDIITLNKEKKEISLFECKWGSLDSNEAEIILAELKIAKEILDKEKLRDRGYMVFDLGDFATFCSRADKSC